MHIPRIYCSGPLQAGSKITLPAERSHHLIRVLRLKLADPVILFNGEGGQYRGQLNSITKHSAIVDLQHYENINNVSPISIELVQAISTSDRMDWVLQKATELGVHTITPILTELSQGGLKGEHWVNRMAHWQKVIISASEQSGRCALPMLNTPRSLTDWLAQTRSGLSLIADPRANSSIADFTPALNVHVLVGPEGGFTEAELERAKASAVQLFRLGPRILRTETAAVAALSVIQNQWGDLK